MCHLLSVDVLQPLDQLEPDPLELNLRQLPVLLVVREQVSAEHGLKDEVGAPSASTGRVVDLIDDVEDGVDTRMGQSDQVLDFGERLNGHGRLEKGLARHLDPGSLLVRGEVDGTVPNETPRGMLLIVQIGRWYSCYVEVSAKIGVQSLLTCLSAPGKR